jgi:hypothetical protein
MIFKKQSPNGHTFLISVNVPKEDADKLIEENLNNPKNKGWYSFELVNDEVVVGNNLWNDLGLNKYPSTKSEEQNETSKPKRNRRR